MVLFVFAARSSNLEGNQIQEVIKCEYLLSLIVDHRRNTSFPDKQLPGNESTPKFLYVVNRTADYSNNGEFLISPISFVVFRGFFGNSGPNSLVAGQEVGQREGEDMQEMTKGLESNPEQLH